MKKYRRCKLVYFATNLDRPCLMDNMALRSRYIAVLEHPRLQIETKKALELVIFYLLSPLLTDKMQITTVKHRTNGWAIEVQVMSGSNEIRYWCSTETNWAIQRIRRCSLGVFAVYPWTVRLYFYTLVVFSDLKVLSFSEGQMSAFHVFSPMNAFEFSGS